MTAFARFAACVLIGLAGPTLARAEEDQMQKTSLSWPAEPCPDSVTDPIVTPVRDQQLDLQRSACLRDELSAGVLAHALIDTPGFHGVLGGGLNLGGRKQVSRAVEVSAQVLVVDYTFVQDAVNKVTHVGVGPIVAGVTTGGSIGRGARGALALRVEVPYASDSVDSVRTSSQLAALVSGRLTSRTILHGRLAVLGMVATSPGGTTRQLAFMAGSDIAWHVRTRVALQLGADAMAGWHGGFDHLLVRGGVGWRVGGDAWRLRLGAGAPLGGAERTNVVVDLGVVVDR